MAQLRSPYFATIRRLIAEADHSSYDHPRSGLTRRAFLGAASAAILSPRIIKAFPQRPSGSAMPKIVIVGAGLAGLTAAYSLKKAGFESDIFEASPRIGGRVMTVEGALGSGLLTEFGGEFIDSGHKEILGLAAELGLELLDRRTGRNPSLKKGYFFKGDFYSDDDIIADLRTIIKTLRSDASLVRVLPTYDHSHHAKSLDQLSLSGYLDSIAMPAKLRALFETAFVTEYGLELREQSTLNFFTVLPTIDSAGKFSVFGDSDEVYKIKGGNERIAKELAAKIGKEAMTSCSFESLRSQGRGYSLSFRTEASSIQIEADVVILTIPFSVLRSIEIKAELPQWKRRAIDLLGYGTNSKAMIGFTKPTWEAFGSTGEIFSDESFQLCWANSEMQKQSAAGITVFTGGRAGMESGRHPLQDTISKYMYGLEKALPGISKDRSYQDASMYWPGNRYTLGSYSAYKPGQWTTIRGAEYKPVGNLFFAGEHCSLDSQGYMNGAVQTGLMAARDIIERFS